MKSVLSILLVVSLIILTQSLREKANNKVKINSNEVNLIQKQFTGVPPPKDSPTATPSTNYGYATTTSDSNTSTTLKGDTSGSLSSANRETSSGKYTSFKFGFISLLIFISFLF